MGLKTYLILIGICTLICWASFILVLYYINPLSADWLGFLFFYGSLFLALTGAFSILGFIARFLFRRDLAVYKQINIASRQAIMLAILLLSVLTLQSQKYLFWWNILLIVIIFSLIELFFISYRRNR